MKIKNNNLASKIIIIIGLIILPIIVELFMFGTIEIGKPMAIRTCFIYGIYAIIILYKILNKYNKQLKKIGEWLLKKRYIIALIALVVLVIGKINFSSIEQWKNYTGETEWKGNIIGKSRSIRSDEWVVQTPIAMGQATSGNTKMYNEHIEQGKVNLLMTTAPVLDIVSISRPLTWGFLIFGAEFGYSFYWALKIILLIMVSLELAIKVSKKDTLLSITGGIILALAPAMMWWLSTAVAEGYIFGMAVVILFSYYMENLDWKIWKKILIAIGIIIFLPAFAFTLYPAYQVPIAFVMAVFMLNDFIKHRKELTKQDYIIMGTTIILVLGVIARFVILCMDDIKIMMSTVYPGSRFEKGGTVTPEYFIKYFMDIFLPYTSDATINASESSSYIYPFIGLIVLIIANMEEIKNCKDSNKALTISLVVLMSVLLIWEFIGFPKFLAKITFLYFSPAERTHLVLGVVGTLLTILMIKKVSENKSKIKKMQAIVISMLTIGISYTLINQSGLKEFFTPFKTEIVMVMIFSMTYFLLIGNKKAWCYTMCGIAIVAGICVNPIVSGTDILYKTEIAQEIQKIKKEDENAIWLARTNLNGQYLIVNGVTCINGVHTYPNFEWIEKVDPEGKYEEVYNRYAHISAILSDNTEFKLMNPDCYDVYLTYNNLKDLNVKYYYSSIELTEEQKEKFNTTEVYGNTDKSQFIYKIN